jgi:hypothetical protein
MRLPATHLCSSKGYALRHMNLSYARAHTGPILALSPSAVNGLSRGLWQGSPFLATFSKACETQKSCSRRRVHPPNETGGVHVDVLILPNHQHGAFRPTQRRSGTPHRPNLPKLQARRLLFEKFHLFLENWEDCTCASRLQLTDDCAMSPPYRPQLFVVVTCPLSIRPVVANCLFQLLF